VEDDYFGDNLLVVLRDLLMVVAPTDLSPGEILALLATLGAVVARAASRSIPFVDGDRTPYQTLNAMLERITPHDLKSREVMLLVAILRPVAERVEATPTAVA